MGARWAVDLIDAPVRLNGAMSAMLAGVAVVENLRCFGSGDGPTRPGGHPRRRPGGRRVGGRRLRPQAQHTGDRRRDRDRLYRTRRRQTRVAELSAALAGALAEQSNRQDSAEQALAALNESDAAISAIYEQLGRLGKEVRSPRRSGGGCKFSATNGSRSAQAVEELSELETRLRTARRQAVVETSPESAGRSRRPPRRHAASRSRPAGGSHRRGAGECRSRQSGFLAARGRAERERACVPSRRGRRVSTRRKWRPPSPTVGAGWPAG